MRRNHSRARLVERICARLVPPLRGWPAFRRRFSLSVALIALSACDPGPQTQLVGAGATFLSPLVDAWIDQFNEDHPKSAFLFSATGSGLGIDLFASDAVDFAFSELPIDAKNMPRDSYFRVPVIAGCLVVTFNLDGIDEINLSRADLVAIFSGEITNWSDPRLRSDNPAIDFPDLPISVVHREDPSGSSYNFSSFLSLISPEWRDSIGAGSTVYWPLGRGALGTNALLKELDHLHGAISYADLGRAESAPSLGIAIIENKSGNFVRQSEASIKTALEVVGPFNPAHLLDPSDPEASPLSLISYMYLHRSYATEAKATAMIAFAEYILSEGQRQAESLEYVPIPESLRLGVMSALAEIGL